MASINVPEAAKWPGLALEEPKDAEGRGDLCACHLKASAAAITSFLSVQENVSCNGNVFRELMVIEQRF